MPPSGVAVTVEAVVAAPLEPAFADITPIDLSTIFTGYGPLPAVTGVRDQTGEWDHAGAERVVMLADGSSAREQLTAYEAPAHFAYRLGPFDGPMRHLVSHVDGGWWFAEAGPERTAITWTYTFRPRVGRATAVRAVLAPLWRRYAEQVLALAVDAAERAQRQR